MAFYSPQNEYFLPQLGRLDDPSVKAKFNKYSFMGAVYGGGISALYSSPAKRVGLMTLSWAAIFGLGFTRGLYNTPGSQLKVDSYYKPDFRTQADGSYRDNDWVPRECIDKWCPQEEIQFHSA